jgi:hypothetical protein
MKAENALYTPSGSLIVKTGRQAVDSTVQKVKCTTFQGAKMPNMSRIKYVGFEAYALMELLAVGTIAMFEVVAPSTALSVAASGCGSPSGHMVR